MAGNLLSGVPLDANAQPFTDEYEKQLARLAVRRARAIVAETKRTEPAKQPQKVYKP
jgi:hypothetical protein